MQRSVRFLLPLVISLSVGCAGTRNAPKYAWLRKQGPVQAAERPVAVASNARSVGVQDAGELGTTTASVSTDHAPGDLRRSVSSPTSISTTEAKSQGAFSRMAVQQFAAQQDTSYYNPEPRKWNIKGISALPIGLATVIIGIASQSIYLLLIGGAIAFALGLIGSRQCRDREERGKGFAIAGMALGAAALFFSLMVLILAA